MVSSSDIHINGKVSYICPKHFNLVTYKSWSEEWRVDIKKSDDFFTSFETRCESCPANYFTTDIGQIHVYPYRKKNNTLVLGRQKWNQYVTDKLCLPCPPGAICNGNIIPLDNHWGYRINSKTIVFKKCPNGYCCSSQSTKCTTYDTCNLGRTGVLCGSCDIGYAQSFVSDGCIWKDGVECNLG